MAEPHDIDGVLVQWGDRLFYPGNRIVKTRSQPKLGAWAARQRAAVIRERIEATVVRRAAQVMVKVTGGGRGMRAIAAHLDGGRHRQEPLLRSLSSADAYFGFRLSAVARVAALDVSFWRKLTLGFGRRRMSATTRKPTFVVERRGGQAGDCSRRERRGTTDPLRNFVLAIATRQRSLEIKAGLAGLVSALLEPTQRLQPAKEVGSCLDDLDGLRDALGCSPRPMLVGNAFPQAR